MYSVPGRLEATSASLWMTTVSKPFGAISRAILATSAEGHETRILGGITLPCVVRAKRSVPVIFQRGGGHVAPLLCPPYGYMSTRIFAAGGTAHKSHGAM